MKEISSRAIRHFYRKAAIPAFFLLLTSLNAQSARPGSPETVLATFHVQSSQLPAFLSMMAEYQDLLRAKSLVTATPIILLQGDEDGKPFVVELFTWKSRDIPDHAPPEVLAYWNKMNAMVEKRGGHDGIEFSEMTPVPPINPAAK